MSDNNDDFFRIDKKGNRGPRGNQKGGGTGHDRACFKCNQTGHISRDCPEASSSSSSRAGGNDRSSGGGAGNDRACFKCNQTGHISRDCPEASSGGYKNNNNNNNQYNGGNRGNQKGGSTGHDRACFKCNQTGHISRDCPEASSSISSRAGGNDRSCYKCNQTGHISRDCPESSSSISSRAGGNDRNCFKCNQPGHISRDCPGVDGNNNNSGNNRRKDAADNQFYSGGQQQSQTKREGGNKRGGGGDNPFYNEKQQQDDNEDNTDTTTEKKSFKVTEVDTQTRNYLEKINEVITDKPKDYDDDTDELDHNIIIENALKEIESKATLVATDRICSFILEGILKRALPSQIIMIASMLQYDFMVVATHVNGSRVLESIIVQIPVIIAKAKKSDLIKFQEILFKLVDILVENISSVIEDRSAPFVLSKLFNIMSGTVTEKFSTSKGSKHNQSEEEKQREIIVQSYEAPTAYKEKIQAALTTIHETLKEKLPLLIFNNKTRETIKTIIELSCSNTELFNSILDTILTPQNEGQTEKDRFLEVIYNKFGSLIFESILKSCPNTSYSRIFSLMRLQLVKFSEDLVSNHVVKSLIENVRDNAQLATLIQELKDNFKKLIGIYI
ncbi:hypothetical protein PPL_04556 [Heterostelium album PN500]|uniref:CCHC-type domain-containing protein n=1 Tax=Heterostelium pallidum (strain ATCC 26659 / Pp 5 / PN500) TaxID=670386 RepID=D3B7W8_HETP5|nr:hypothetical protein PPL_04556 [Heterostelium album PN500]EFA82861.1 hypothetical protein PPL_04556 [Heterostelium album PN500]|eukprot:XP_020434978.1 hypothetical protein PPL_04556 [Heterostelium album PN500]